MKSLWNSAFRKWSEFLPWGSLWSQDCHLSSVESVWPRSADMNRTCKKTRWPLHYKKQDKNSYGRKAIHFLTWCTAACEAAGWSGCRRSSSQASDRPTSSSSPWEPCKETPSQHICRNYKRRLSRLLFNSVYYRFFFPHFRSLMLHMMSSFQFTKIMATSFSVSSSHSSRGLWKIYTNRDEVTFSARQISKRANCFMAFDINLQQMSEHWFMLNIKCLQRFSKFWLSNIKLEHF